MTLFPIRFFSYCVSRKMESKIMHAANTNPKVSCHIVCQEYMQATGFFLRTDEDTFLVTARHNVLPTNSDELNTGEWMLSYETSDFLPVIDIYLRDGDSYSIEQVDVREKDGLLFDSAIDVLGVPIDFDPETYGYVTWTTDEFVPTDVSPEKFDVIGFPGCAIPDDPEYGTEAYVDAIDDPYVLPLAFQGQVRAATPFNTGLLGIGVITASDADSVDYRGYSGSPVLSDGLLGVHIADQFIRCGNMNTGEQSSVRVIVYWRTEVLNRLLGQQR